MQLIDEIIALATDDKTSPSVLLRKCLVLAHRLKNERLRSWAGKELDGYADDDTLPDYRKTFTISKGFFLGPLGSWIKDQPIPTMLMKDEHQAIVENAMLRTAARLLRQSVRLTVLSAQTSTLDASID